MSFSHYIKEGLESYTFGTITAYGTLLWGRVDDYGTFLPKYIEPSFVMAPAYQFFRKDRRT